MYTIVYCLIAYGYAGRIFNAGILRRGKVISEFRSPKTLPLHPHPLGHGNQCYIFDV